MVEELIPLLEQLAVQMNTTVEFLWGVMIKQAQVFAISYIVDVVIVIAITITFIKVFAYFRTLGDFMIIPKKEEARWGAFAGFSLVLGIASLIGIIAIGSLFNTFLTALLNPEYWALQQILEYIR